MARALLVFTASALVSVAAKADNDVQKAVERGISYLKNHPSADGTWSFRDQGHAVGVSSLVGLALLECDVPATDPVIEAAAQVVREKLASTDDTYDLSLAIMFLDRLGVADDSSHIETASLRVAAGQFANGGWGYYCPRINSEADLRRLRTLLDKKATTKTEKPAETLAKKGVTREGNLQNTRDARRRMAMGDDNSNTQFATLALWVARRHNVHVDACLAAVEARFRQSQNGDGGWGYKPRLGSQSMPGMVSSTASMTCAGLFGLGVGYGVSMQAVLRTNLKQKAAASNEHTAPDPTRDQAIRRGLRFLAEIIEPALEEESGNQEEVPNRRGAGRAFRRGARGVLPNLVHNGAGSEYYFLWGLERVAMIYGLTTIGNKDWYEIGSTYLVQEQGEDGSWRGNIGEIVDTCFALLFLRRANLAVDLTATLKDRVKDPGMVSLKAKRTTEVGEKKEAAKSKTDKSRATELAGKDSGSEPESKSIDRPRVPLVDPSTLPESRPQAEKDNQEGAHLRDQLVQAAPADQTLLLQRLRDAKGSIHTDALAEAIPLLRGEIKTQACDALAERLARMTAPTLREKLHDKNTEVQRAAALASAMKEDKTFIPDLIRLLEDPEPRVARASQASLKQLTGQDFGPAEGATDQEKADAVTHWRQWWQKNNGRR
jgi:hypothetical protein